jgi:shikimate kinase
VTGSRARPHAPHPGTERSPGGASLAGSVFLIGLMGSGKTTVGRRLATLLGKEFLDSDQEIEQRTGVGIPLIFEIEGEAGFRQRETRMIAELTARENVVLATGGGAILSEENRAALRNRGKVVYLHADLETLVRRTRRDRNRPLLQTADPRGKMSQLLEAREPLYRATAHLVVSSGQRSAQAVAREIATRLQALDPHAESSADDQP